MAEPLSKTQAAVGNTSHALYKKLLASDCCKYLTS